MPTKEKSQLETKVEQELDDLLASLGSEVTTVKLYRIEGGKQQALATYTPSELAANPEEIIGGEYGPGRYLVRAVLPTLPGKPGNRWGPSKVIDLAEDSQYVQVYLRKHAADPEPVNQQDPFYRMMELQLKLSEQRASDMDKRLAQQNDQFHQLILAMIQNKNNNSDIGSLISGVKDLKALSDGNGNGSRFEELKELLEIAALFKDGGGKDESPWTTLSKVVTSGLLAKQRESAAPAALPAPDPKKLTPATAELTSAGATMAESPEVSRAADTRPESPEPAMEASKKNLTLQLVRKAQKGRDPELWADWSIEQADDEADDDAIRLVDEIAKSPTFTAWWSVFSEKLKTLEIDPALLRSWWETYYERVKDVIKENAPGAAAGGAS